MPASSPKACVTAFIDAMVRRDMAAARDLLTDDVALFYSNGTALWGKDAFEAVMTASWKLVENYTYATVESQWLAEADTAAAVIYTFTWSGTASGNAVSGGGRGTRMLRHDAAGWRIAHEHLSTGTWKPA